MPEQRLDVETDMETELATGNTLKEPQATDVVAAAEASFDKAVGLEREHAAEAPLMEPEAADGGSVPEQAINEHMEPDPDQQMEAGKAACLMEPEAADDGSMPEPASNEHMQPDPDQQMEAGKEANGTADPEAERKKRKLQLSREWHRTYKKKGVLRDPAATDQKDEKESADDATDKKDEKESAPDAADKKDEKESAPIAADKKDEKESTAKQEKKQKKKSGLQIAHDKYIQDWCLVFQVGFSELLFRHI